MAPASELHAPEDAWGESAAARIVAAVRGSGRREAGWRITGIDGEELELVRSGLTLRAHRRSTDVPPGRARLDTPVTLTMPSGMVGSRFTTIHGDAPPERPAVTDRFYWNVRPEGRVPLVSALTGTLNGSGIPFRLKCVNSAAVVRCDAAVLYSPATRRPDVVRVVRDVLDEVSPALRATAPTLTLRLAAGLGFAESPSSEGESFGSHRCRIVAEALVAAAAAGITSASGRLSVVEGRFRRAGLSIVRPHLNPGSDPRVVPAPFAS